ncbi:urocortin 3, like [Gouania willdenowi]|nr:urocortin-3-like [Gouania willdenowi]
MHTHFGIVFQDFFIRASTESFICEEKFHLSFPWVIPARWTRSEDSMLKTLLLLSVLCAPSSSWCLRLYQSGSDLLCFQPTTAALHGAENDPGPSSVEGWGSLPEYPISSSSSYPESSRERRTSSPSSYRFLSHTKLRGQMLPNSSSSRADRRSRLTLSLDVPTNIMNVLFDVAKAQNMRAKAAQNARVLALIGRRK